MTLGMCINSPLERDDIKLCFLWRAVFIFRWNTYGKRAKISFRKKLWALLSLFLYPSVSIYLYLYLSLWNSRPHKPGCLANYPLMCLLVRSVATRIRLHLFHKLRDERVREGETNIHHSLFSRENQQLRILFADVSLRRSALSCVLWSSRWISSVCVDNYELSNEMKYVAPTTRSRPTRNQALGFTRNRVYDSCA